MFRALVIIVCGIYGLVILALVIAQFVDPNPGAVPPETNDAPPAQIENGDEDAFRVD